MSLFSDGQCCGVALWMEYRLGLSKSLSTGLISSPVIGQKLKWHVNSRQGVQLFRKPIAVSASTFVSSDSTVSGSPNSSAPLNNKLKFRIVFKPKTGDFEFNFDIIS